MIEYSLFEKTQYSDPSKLKELPPWDVFISAFNLETRVQVVYEYVQARHKIWIALPEYQLESKATPAEAVWPDGNDEVAIVGAMVEAAKLKATDHLCIDATGILRHYLVVLLKTLQLNGVSTFHILYSEPARYDAKESTEFSSAELKAVRQVHGFEGSHSTDTSSDVLIIAAGYEHRMVAAVADEKNHAQKQLIYAFPSLRPDMIQESTLATYKAFESIGRGAYVKPQFAPAYDPFVAAQSIAQVRQDFINQNGKISNLYLAPLSTKPMAIGFALFYILECSNTATSILQPFMTSYASKSSQGISRVWLYKIEFVQ